jgi:lambda family phage portal protein
MWFKKEPTKKRRTIRKVNVRGFAAAEDSNILSDFKGTSKSIDAELSSGLRKMRMRSRTLSQDNDYAKKYLSMVRSNVVGASGFMLQGKAKKPDGSLDQTDNEYIEKSFKKWGSYTTCTMSKKLSWGDVQNLFIETVARDGEALCVIVYGKDLPYGMALQMVDIDLLDESYNVRLDNGNQIRMGVEQDKYGAPVAYHLLSEHPGDDSVYTYMQKRYKKIPASEVIHAFISERPGQSRGAPWMHTAIRRLNMLGGMEEAELVASRVAASKMGFFTSPDGDGYVGDDEEEEEGALISDAEPGVFEQLPEGVSFQTFDPQHPSTAFDSFVKTVLRGAASGLNVAYNTLANDLEGVSFSSIRSGTIEERDQWKQKQSWMIEHFCMPVYLAWLKSAILSGKLNLPMVKIEKFEEVIFQSRGWNWVDPRSDSIANEMSIKMGVTTRSEIAAAQGKNLEDIFEQLSKEQELADKYGLDITGEKKDEQKDEQDD